MVSGSRNKSCPKFPRDIFGRTSANPLLGCMQTSQTSKLRLCWALLKSVASFINMLVASVYKFNSSHFNCINLRANFWSFFLFLKLGWWVWGRLMPGNQYVSGFSNFINTRLGRRIPIRRKRHTTMSLSFLQREICSHSKVPRLVTTYSYWVQDGGSLWCEVAGLPICMWVTSDLLTKVQLALHWLYYLSIYLSDWNCLWLIGLIYARRVPQNKHVR